jgi:hypothetical protein
MPNWTNNIIEINHDNPEMIERAFNALSEGKFFNEFLPCPQDLLDTMSGFHGKGTPEQEKLEQQQKENIAKHGFSDWYSWNIANWGTKWEACEPFISGHDSNFLSASYDTAWSPPTRFYEHLQELGFVVRAYYFEPGMGFCGIWDDGDDQYYEIEGDSEWVMNNIPHEIDYEFGISEGMAEWEEQERADQL